MGLSLRELAERSGVSAPMLSQVERGDTSPTLTVAGRSPQASSLTLSQLLRLDEAEHVVVVPKGSGRTREREGHRTEELTPALPGAARGRLAPHARSRRRNRRPQGPADARGRRSRDRARPRAARSRSSSTARTHARRGRRRHLRRRPSAPLRKPRPRSVRVRRRRRRRTAALIRRQAMPKTMFEKIWEAHEVSDGLIYIDLHLVHEVTSPQAFDGLRLAERKVRRPDRTLATADHNVPTDGTPTAAKITDVLSRKQVETLEENCAEFGVPIYSLGSDLPGHRPRDRPRAGRDAAGHDDRLRRLPHLDARRLRRAGVRHRHLGGRARPRHADADAEAPEDDAHLLLGRAGQRRRRQGPDPRDDRQARHGRHGRPRGRVRGGDDGRASRWRTG